MTTTPREHMPNSPLTYSIPSDTMDIMEDKEKDTRANLKVDPETRRKIRLIAALTGEQMRHVIDRLVDSELARLTQGNLQQHKGGDTKT